jgi:hypothetical protein
MPSRPRPLLVLACLALAGCEACPPGAGCPEPTVECQGGCVNPTSDARHCGACGNACAADETCRLGVCNPCPSPRTVCGPRCVSLQSDGLHCGACGQPCYQGTCTDGQCVCRTPFVRCPDGCAHLATSPRNCGACGARCGPTQACRDGGCVNTCPAGTQECPAGCARLATDRFNCGACGVVCGPNLQCVQGACLSALDPDRDGFSELTGDCCESTSTCPNPTQVNPNAPEVPNNQVDDDCDGKVDEPEVSCDNGLPVTPSSPEGYARAMDLCTGLLSAELQLADGRPLPGLQGVGIHTRLGGLLPEVGNRFLVLGSGFAQDATSISPDIHRTQANLSVCAAPTCVKDWLDAARPPAKLAGKLPSAPACPGASDVVARDSVMLVLRLRAPANANSFSFVARFYSEEYPEYVCSPFNDQLVALVDAPGNPADGNLMTARLGGQDWPVGINVAAGTALFQVCDAKATRPACWDARVSESSCGEGRGLLKGTYLDGDPAGCVVGGATARLLTQGNVAPGQEFTLRIAVWDVGDELLDSYVTLDAFEWGPGKVTPGTGGTRPDGGIIVD